MTKKELSTLKDLYSHILMDRCQFHPPKELAGHYPGNWPEQSERFTADVKEGTEVWRNTWILCPLAQLIHKHDTAWAPAESWHLE